MVLDISNPRTPRAFAQSEVLPGVVSQVKVADSWAYVAVTKSGTGESRLLVLSVADPSRPRLIDSLALQSPALGLAVHGSYAYVAGGTAGLQIIDVSDPTALRRMGSVETGGKVTVVAVAGDYAYLTEDRSTATSLAGNLWTVDISNPAAPQLVSSLAMPYYAQAITISGNYAYLACAGLCVMDISEPRQPRQVGMYEQGSFHDDVAVADGYAFISTDQYCDVVSICSRQVGIVDVTDPTRPRRYDYQAGSVREVGLGAGRGLVVQGVLMYVATESGLRVLEIPAGRRVGEYLSIGLVADIAVSDKFVYLVDGHSDLRILDLHNPADPTVGYLE